LIGSYSGRARSSAPCKRHDIKRSGVGLSAEVVQYSVQPVKKETEVVEGSNAVIIDGSKKSAG
jgi:hypothetical protein